MDTSVPLEVYVFAGSSGVTTHCLLGRNEASAGREGRLRKRSGHHEC